MQSILTTSTSIACAVMARASVRITAGELPALRRAPGRLGGVDLPASLLRHADEQTVVGLAAVLRAIDDAGLDAAGFGEWGVVAAPEFFGRAAFDAAFPDFLAEGAWGVSPHLVPSHSLHSASGMISQALKAHGPNLGVGGAPGCAREAFLAAASFLDGGLAPAVWVVLTGWDPGRPSGDVAGDSHHCAALALALAAPGRYPRLCGLHVGPDTLALDEPAGFLDGPTEGARSVADWFAAASARSDAGRSTFWRLDRGHAAGNVPHPSAATSPRGFE